MANPIFFTETQRGKAAVLFENNLFKFAYSLKNGKSSWICTKNNCTARITVDQAQTSATPKRPHNHESNGKAAKRICLQNASSVQPMVSEVKTEIQMDIAEDPGPDWRTQDQCSSITRAWAENNTSTSITPSETNPRNLSATVGTNMKAEPDRQTETSRQGIKVEPVDDYGTSNQSPSVNKGDEDMNNFTMSTGFQIKLTATNIGGDVIKIEPIPENNNSDVIKTEPVIENISNDMQAQTVTVNMDCEVQTEAVKTGDRAVQTKAAPNIMTVTGGAVRLEPTFSDDEDHDRTVERRQNVAPAQSMKAASQELSPSSWNRVQPMSNAFPSPLAISAYICQSCSATFALFSSWELHMVSCHGETLLDAFSMISSSGPGNIVYHNSKERGISGSKAKRVGVYGANKAATENKTQEVAIKAKKPLMCDICGRGFCQESRFQTHKKMHAEEKPLVCEICGKTFTKKYCFNRHMIVHTGEKPFPCDICGAAFAYKDLLKTHRRTHTGEKPYTCDICGAAFCQTNELKTHKRYHTGEKPYVCHFCGAGFCQSSALKKHQRLHTGDKPYKCEFCGTSFSHCTTLKVHKRTHTGEKPYKCDVCGKAYSTLNVLQSHKRYHTGEKPFVCDTCGMAFPERNKLKRHKRTHTGERPYVCPECGRGFATHAILRSHHRLHTGEKPYTCPHCPAAFPRARSLKRHVEKCHQ